MVRLVANDLKEKSKYSQNPPKMSAIFVDISPEIVVRVSLMHFVVRAAKPNSISALCKQRSLQHAKVTSVPASPSHLLEKGQTGNTWFRFNYTGHNPVFGSYVLQEHQKLFG